MRADNPIAKIQLRAATRLLITLTCLGVVVVQGVALAQPFEKFNEAARDQLPASPFVAAAYGFIWVAILTYVFVVARGLSRAEKEIQSLKARIESRGQTPSPR